MHYYSGFRTVLFSLFSATLLSSTCLGTQEIQANTAAAATTPSPLLDSTHPVDWWFAFKFNTKSFPGCGTGAAVNSCRFGGTLQNYSSGYSQQFIYASSTNPALTQGGGCVGATLTDPVGATFDAIYNGSLNYVIWNDQFYSDPAISACSGDSCSAPWGHSKGAIAWDSNGNGFIMQVSTPSWPASGNHLYPRKTDGNTLGCVADNDVEVSQHFFSLRLTKTDLVAVLNAMSVASVVTDPKNLQIVKNGGPSDVQALVAKLGVVSTASTATVSQLSTGVTLIAKPAALQVAPWQMVSAEMGGVSLRTATWWEQSVSSAIPTTTTAGKPACWSTSLGTPGPVAIATSGSWNGTSFSLEGGLGTNYNHAKIGVTTSGTTQYAIFGDMNQEGALSGTCSSAQNGRGGMFFALPNATLAKSISTLIAGSTAAAAAK